MGWETRRNGTYYYRARKIGGHVIKLYVGAGPQAELAALGDELAQEDRRIASAARREARVALAAVDDPLEAFAESVESLTRSSLLLAGYHQHHRGEWRRRQDG
jgi:hypothetical protein